MPIDPAPLATITNDRVAQASWTVLCVTLMYACLYRMAHKDLRLWLVVRSLLKDRQQRIDEAASPDAAENTAHKRQHTFESTGNPRPSRWIKYLTYTSIAAPVLTWLWRLHLLGAGYLDILAIGTSYGALFVSIICVISVQNTDSAIISTPITPTAPKGWEITLTPPSTRLTATLRRIPFLAFPAASAMLCTWMLCGESGRYKRVGDAVFVVMLCLAPLAGVRNFRWVDVRMKMMCLISSAGLAFVVVMAGIILAAARTVTPPNPDDVPPDDGFIAHMFERAATWVLYDLVIQFRTVQLGGMIFVPLFAVLRFEYDQAVDAGAVMYTPLDSGATLRADAEEIDEGEKLANEPKELAGETTPSTASHPCQTPTAIPKSLPAFPSPIFKSGASGAYLSSVLAAILLPDPKLWDIWVLATFVGSTMGLCVGITVRGQWRSLWAYEELWTAKPGEKAEEV